MCTPIDILGQLQAIQLSIELQTQQFVTLQDHVLVAGNRLQTMDNRLVQLNNTVLGFDNRLVGVDNHLQQFDARFDGIQHRQEASAATLAKAANTGIVLRNKASQDIDVLLPLYKEVRVPANFISFFLIVI